MSVQQQQARDEDLFDFNNQLRHGIFEAYAGIINGMSPEKVNQYLLEPSPVRRVLADDDSHVQGSNADELAVRRSIGS